MKLEILKIEESRLGMFVRTTECPFLPPETPKTLDRHNGAFL